MVSRDRWTCPRCQHTVIIDGSDHDVAAAIDACQRRHATEHRKAAAELGRMGLAEQTSDRRRAG